MKKNGKSEEPVKITGFPDDLHDRINAHLTSEVEAGATLVSARKPLNSLNQLTESSDFACKESPDFV